METTLRWEGLGLLEKRQEAERVGRRVDCYTNEQLNSGLRSNVTYLRGPP